MCMGFGCNAAGVVGCRIINSTKEKIIAMVTNAFVPCNGRFPMLITISSIFIAAYFTNQYSSIISTIVVLVIVLIGIILTLIISKILSKTILKVEKTSFVLELPPYRKPQIIKTIIHFCCNGDGLNPHAVEYLSSFSIHINQIFARHFFSSLLRQNQAVTTNCFLVLYTLYPIF